MKDFSKLKTLAFDLDGTLALSKQPVSSKIANLLGKLSYLGSSIAIISGADWPQFEKQVCSMLNYCKFIRLSRFHLFPTCGAKHYWHNGNKWKEITEGAYDFRPEEVLEIEAALSKAISNWEYNPTPSAEWGPQIENRGTQITYSALGQQAPLEAKHNWDSMFKKRDPLRIRIQEMLPRYSVRMGGSTSIDITRKEIDKEFAMRQIGKMGRGFMEQARFDDILFVGDAIFEGGNDWPATKTGCDWIRVDSVDQTQKLLEEILISV